MSTRHSILAIILCAAALSANAANSQNEKMKTCSAQAKEQTLKGDARKSFMKSCLSSGAAAAPAKSMSPQQQKMSSCSSDAKTKGLHGADRKSYMKTCLSAGA
jgi:TRAP-type C4-dicarboxylate transport system substrate-binding protein